MSSTTIPDEGHTPGTDGAVFCPDSTQPTNLRIPTLSFDNVDNQKYSSHNEEQNSLTSPLPSLRPQQVNTYTPVKSIDSHSKLNEIPFVIQILKSIGISDYRLLALRIMVILSLAVTVIIVGYFSFSLLRANEKKLKDQHYRSLVLQLESFVTNIMDDQYQALSLTAGIYRNQCPSATTWPNCSIPFSLMTRMSENLIRMSQNRAIGFSPIIREDQVAELEAFVYDFYESEGMSSLGQAYGFKGIYAKNGSTPYHMTTPATSGENKIFVPIVQIAKISENSKAYMFNLYSESIRIANLDYMINCTLTTNEDCLAITNVVHLVQDATYRPAVLLHYPIRLDDTNRTLVGLTSGVINWDTALSSSLPSHVSGICIVLEAERNGIVQYYTFEIVNGVATFSKNGDNHDTDYDSSKHSFAATPFGGSASFRLHIYSSSTFENEYYTQGPVIVCIISVIVVVVTSFIFLIYDLLMNRRAKEKELVIQTRQQFVRFISHEIRTPVNTISLGMKLFCKEIQQLISLLSSELTVRELTCKLSDMLELVGDVDQSSDAAIVILNDLINYDKLKGGILNLEVEEIGILDLVRNVVRPFKVQARQAGVNFDIDILASSGQFNEAVNMLALGDKVKISQVIRNLVSNAFKFTPPGGTVTITAMWNREGLPKAERLVIPACTGTFPHGENVRAGSLLLLVKDSGIGLTEEQQQNLFREGVQFNANKLQGGGGSGLGLFIAKGIAELHGGTLSAISEGINKGSVFTLEMPVYLRTGSLTEEGDTFQGDIEVGFDQYSSFSTAGYEAIMSHDDAEHSDISVANHNSELSCMSSSLMMISPLKDEVKTRRRKHHILVVDDSPTARKMVSKLLSNEGYQVEQCIDGQTCLDLVLSKFQPSETTPYFCAVLLDSDMPGISGLEVVSRLRKEGYPWPVIGVTGHVHQKDIDNFITHGATMVLSKPLNYPHLEKVLNGYT